MPIDELAGEVLGAAVEFVGDALTDVVAESPRRRSRFRRFVYWSVLALLGGAVLVFGYLLLS